MTLKERVREAIHDIAYRTDVMKKDGIGTVYVCSDRILYRFRHAYFYPELDPPLRYPVSLEQIHELLDADSPAEIVRRLKGP
jgi:hypothetical protein